jgi:hypothetical protein
MLRICLYGLSKRRQTVGLQQPERYVKYNPKFFEKYIDKNI